jgi:hypothetical protein
MGEGFPHLVEMQKKYGPENLVVLTVTLDNPKDAEARAVVEKHLAKKAWPFRTVNLDADPEKLPATLDFGGGVPGAFVFNRDNRYVKKAMADGFSYDTVEKAVAEAVKKK